MQPSRTDARRSLHLHPSCTPQCTSSQPSQISTSAPKTKQVTKASHPHRTLGPSAFFARKKSLIFSNTRCTRNLLSFLKFTHLLLISNSICMDNLKSQALQHPYLLWQMGQKDPWPSGSAASACSHSSSSSSGAGAAAFFSSLPPSALPGASLLFSRTFLLPVVSFRLALCKLFSWCKREEEKSVSDLFPHPSQTRYKHSNGSENYQGAKQGTQMPQCLPPVHCATLSKTATLGAFAYQNSTC